jgi:hypothetical protein
MMARLIGFAFVGLLLTGLVGAQEDITPQSNGAPGLEKVKGAEFTETYAVPGTDFGRYENLFVDQMDFEYRDVGPARPIDSGDLSNPNKTVFGISDVNRLKFEENFTEAFLKELGEGRNFTVVGHIGENTLIMRVGVVDIVSRTPPETVGITEVYLAVLAEATLEIEFLDGLSGETVAKISDRGRIGSPTEHIDAFTLPANRATVWYQVRRWATNAARRLRDELDSALGEDAVWRV